MKRAVRILFVITAMLLLACSFAWAQRREPGSVRGKKAPLSSAVRDMPVMTPSEVRVLVPRRRRTFPPERKGGGVSTSLPSSMPVDAAAQTQPGPQAPTIDGVNSAGLGDGTLGFTVFSAPPDTDGAVGATQYVQVVNTAFAVFDKLTMTLLTGPTATNLLWAALPAGNPCRTTNDGDGIVLYDQFADRWIITQFARAGSTTGPWYECVAVSRTGDATGQYFLYFFSYPEFPDYPKLGVWPDAYYATYNTFTSPVGSGIGGKYCAFDRERMLNGVATLRGAAGPSLGGLHAGNGQVCFNIADFGVLPADVDGDTLPPAGSPNYGLEWFIDTDLAIWRFHVDWTTLTASTMNGIAWVSPSGPASGTIPINLIPVTSFTAVCDWLSTGDQTCVPQPEPAGPPAAAQLDSLTDRLMHRLPYRNFGTHEVLLANHSVQVASPTRAGIRWYEVRNPSGTPSVVQTGTFAPDTTTWRWMGSMAMDKFGNIAMGYSRSGTAVFPSIHYATRLSTDSVGTLSDEKTIIVGSGSQTDGLDRWGDYSAMSVDPQDDCTFWYTTEYLAADGSFNWQTRIASFKLAQCGSEAFNLSVTPSTGSGASQVFSFLYSDTAGGININTAEGLFNTTASPASACAFRYNEDANTIQLYLDNGIGFTSAVTPGSAGTLANSQCTINLPTTLTGTAGNHLVVNVDVTFASPSFAGAKGVWMNVSDPAGTTGWERKGSWTVP